ncbi:MAG: flagellar hook-basal body complex protein FliE [Bacteroidota bacterium]
MAIDLIAGRGGGGVPFDLKARMQRGQDLNRAMRQGGQIGVGDEAALPQPRGIDGDDAFIDVYGSSFTDTMQDLLNSVDMDQKVSNEQIEAFVAGEQDNVHEVMVAMNRAQLSFQFMTEVRNKGLETYQELMRMQI